jgi:hypothetical protein
VGSSAAENGQASEDFGALALLVLLQLLGETRVELGLDGDASAVFDRSLEIGGAFRAIGLSAAAGDALAAFRRNLRTAEPAVSRLADLRVLTPRVP